MDDHTASGTASSDGERESTRGGPGAARRFLDGPTDPQHGGADDMPSAASVTRDWTQLCPLVTPLRAMLGEGATATRGSSRHTAHTNRPQEGVASLSIQWYPHMVRRLRGERALPSLRPWLRLSSYRRLFAPCLLSGDRRVADRVAPPGGSVTQRSTATSNKHAISALRPLGGT